MKALSLIVSLLLTAISFSQNSTESLNFKQVGWMIELPTGFKFKDSAASEASKNRGLKAIEDANGLELDISDTKTLFSGYLDGSYFDATVSPFEYDSVGYMATSKHSREMLFKTFEKKLPGTTVDSSLISTTIDGLKFDKFQIRVNMDDKVFMTLVLLGRHVKG